MSFNLPGAFVLRPYQGAIISQRMSICDKQGGKVVPINVVWSNYPTQAISFDLGQGTIAQLDKIRAVYIDNLKSVQTMFIRFPDTGMVIAVQPFTAIYIPAITDGVQVELYADVAAVGQTAIFFFNVYIDGFANTTFNQAADLVLASTSGTAQGFAYKAAGDISRSIVAIPLTTLNAQFQLLTASAIAGSAFFITSFAAYVYGCYNTNGSSFVGINISNLAQSTVIFTFYIPVNTDLKMMPRQEVFRQNNCQISLANVNWYATIINGIASAGFMDIYFAVTQAPPPGG